MNEEPTTPVPDLNLAHHIFVLKSPRQSAKHAESQAALAQAIETHKLAPLMEYLKTEKVPGFEEINPKTHADYKKDNQAQVAKLEEDIAAAKESEDDSQIFSSWLALGNFYASICDRELALSTLQKAFEVTAASGSKIDITFTRIRVAMLFNDRRFISQELETAGNLIEKGGDWERKNRYKVYKGINLMSARQFKEAAPLLIDSFATFTCTELASYEQVVSYGIVCGILALNRVDLKKKIIDSSEVVTVAKISEVNALNCLANALYSGEYSTFFEALARVEGEVLLCSEYLAPHSSFFVREMRCKAYAQLLESYLQLSLKSMADTFGVSEDYIDAELSRLIPQKKLNCVIDKVSGTIVTNRPGTKNAQYHQLIRQGDALLTKLQKFGAAVRLHGAQPN